MLWLTPADDRQYLDGYIRHSIRQGYCVSDLDIAGVMDQADKTVSVSLD